MNYHLIHEGRDLGVFPLEELQRRRQSGQLSGTENIRLEGMVEWQPLDLVLQTASVVSLTPPPLPPVRGKKRTREPLAWTLGALLILGLAGATFAAWVLPGFIHFVGQEKRQQPLPQNIPASEGVGAVTKKITWTTNTSTEADARKRGGEFRKRQWLEAYKANGQRETACDAEVVQMIEAWIESQYGEPKSNPVNIAQWSDKLIALPGCDDPMVWIIAGVNSTELYEKHRKLERALAGFSKSRHKAYPRLFAAANSIYSTRGSKQVELITSSAIQSMNECFVDGSFRPEDQPEIAEIFINGWGKDFFHGACLKVYPIPSKAGKSFEWLSLVLEGEYQVIEAWKARGRGDADSVTKQGWEDFHRHLGAAREHFTRAWNLRPDLPLAPSRMIYVAMGDSDPEEMRVWFDRALTAQIDYPKAWQSMRWGLLPRWHGSWEALVALGKRAVDTGRFDTDVPKQLWEITYDLEIESQLSLGQHFYGHPDIWPELSRMYQGYIAQTANQGNGPGWRSRFSVVAFLAGKYDVARKQLEGVNWDPGAYNLSGWGTDVSLMPLEVAARTGSASGKIANAENSYRRSQVADALQRYQELAGATNLDFRTAKFVQHRVAALELEKHLESGEWIDLLPSSTNDPAWKTSFGSFRRLPNGALEVEAGTGHMLFCRARVGLEFEVRGEFEVVKSSNGDYQAGLVMGLPDYNAKEWYGFRMKKNSVQGETVLFGRRWTKDHAAKPIVLGNRNSFQFQFRKGEVSASVNDRVTFQNAPLAERVRNPASEFLVGLGAFSDGNETVLRYHSVQLRRIPSTHGSVEPLVGK